MNDLKKINGGYASPNYYEEINIIRKIYCELNSQNSLFRNGISRIGWILKDDK